LNDSTRSNDPTRSTHSNKLDPLEQGGDTVKVTVDEDRCCGAGQCVLIAPEVFDQRDEDGIVVLLEAEPRADQHAVVRESAAVCPASAIEVTE
jgi:ferredoxin